MRVLVSSLAVIVFALIVVLFLLALKRAAVRRERANELNHELVMLRNFRTLVQNEVSVQLDAGYSDVAPFNHLLNDIKELK